MAHTKVNLPHAAFEACMRRVIQPGQINMLPVEYHYFPQFFLPPQGEAKRNEADEHLQLLNCVMMEDGPHGLATFLRDCEYYRIPENSEESEVPEDSDEESMDDEDE